MTWLLIKLAIRVVVFGIAIGYVLRKNERVTVVPKKALPLVALVFAILNTLPYTIASFTLNLLTLGSLFLFVPFLVNAILLYVTTRILRKVRVKFEIDGLVPYVYTASIVTVAHFALWLLMKLLPA